jgi:DNA-binding YbaB/EbfC family protein
MMNMGKMMKQIQKMQADMAKAQEELAGERVEASAGGGAVRVVANGHSELISVKIDPEAVDPNDIGMLEDLVLAAVNDAQSKAREVASTRMQSVTGKIPLPPGFMG